MLKKLLKKYSKSPSKKGFTLVELLVVIGILGILVAALLATINPVEQLKKAQDASLKNLAAEYVSANVRYFSTHNAMPWFSAANGGAACNGVNTTFNATAISALAACTTVLISEGELKQSFTSASNLSQAFVTNPSPVSGNASDTVVCFQPASLAQQKDPNTKYSNTGGAPAAACKSQGGAANCYWCAQ